MYLLRTEFLVSPGHATEFEARQVQAARAKKGQPGYLGQTLLHSYGDPRKYVNNSRWESVEAVWDYARSDALASFMKGATPGIVTVTLQQGYDAVFEVDAEPMTDPGTCEILVDWTITLGARAEFERTRRELFELRKKTSPGFRSNRLRRSAGTATKYLVLQMYSDLQAARTAPWAPSIREYANLHPYTLYAAEPNYGEAYFVMHRL